MNDLVARFTALLAAIRQMDLAMVEGLLEGIEQPLPEYFLREAEGTISSAVAELLLQHWMITGGFDEDYQSPLMLMIKKGFIKSAANIAYVLTEENRHDFTDQDESGMTVIDWAQAMGEDGLKAYLGECLRQLS